MGMQIVEWNNMRGIDQGARIGEGWVCETRNIGNIGNNWGFSPSLGDSIMFRRYPIADAIHARINAGFCFWYYMLLQAEMEAIREGREVYWIYP